MKHILSAIFLSLAAMAPMTPALAGDQAACPPAGPGAVFCGGAAFNRLDRGGTEGLSYWLDHSGYLTKLVVQQGPKGIADQSVIESQIMAMVSRQAADVGRDFEFSDITSASVGGAPFGTLSYTLAGSGRKQAILHSYVAVKGVIVQVISQIAMKGTDQDPEALMMAHHRALDAIQLTNTDATL